MERASGAAGGVDQRAGPLGVTGRAGAPRRVLRQTRSADRPGRQGPADSAVSRCSLKLGAVPDTTSSPGSLANSTVKVIPSRVGLENFRLERAEPLERGLDCL